MQMRSQKAMARTIAAPTEASPREPAPAAAAAVAVSSLAPYTQSASRQEPIQAVLAYAVTRVKTAVAAAASASVLKYWTLPSKIFKVASIVLPAAYHAHLLL